MTMLGIDPSAQSERENYKLLIGSIIPQADRFCHDPIRRWRCAERRTVQLFHYRDGGSADGRRFRAAEAGCPQGHLPQRRRYRGIRRSYLRRILYRPDQPDRRCAAAGGKRSDAYWANARREPPNRGPWHRRSQHPHGMRSRAGDPARRNTGCTRGRFVNRTCRIFSHR